MPVDALPPYEDEFGAASYEVCLCCGFEFGNDDNPRTAEGDSFERYRWKWVQTGTVWFDPTHRPDDWSLNRQLAAAGLDAFRPDLPRA
ncbi:MAG TPA: hypothetical protein ENG98_01625, partial [Actinobacteria bacterium]|nr:hypothetical protein [Actinomycetota bacterium]